MFICSPFFFDKPEILVNFVFEERYFELNSLVLLNCEFIVCSSFQIFSKVVYNKGNNNPYWFVNNDLTMKFITVYIVGFTKITFSHSK